ncbi:non-ribosomal peptide synthetase [Phytomonospora endophytica]|uniref:Amino acid adenylation domain-containing protein/non-ribosomal peptide synthase protein (TIGR01720 family) n=1 Tax=Phytomonospora endophytica TaxID=714109 RepID=A0A841G1A3_9ACTN|nr:non-ribosomal peptide synthetase [Phytomonospora endophytica]MBB6039532.1 amino acid adenylation domain-containing protein/non-ribosomal peptide synthase protein (TIGR01720 family) [Phytomonospora endophytica]GIG70496.1 hypothetical protein Pen01_67910 [Phytomonospora endophytica]
MSTAATFARRATDHADRPALSCGDRTLTYRELADAVGGVAASLTALGARAGDRVAIVAGRNERMIIAELAVLWIGAAFVPIDRANPEARLRALLADSRPACVITCDEPVDTGLPTLDLRELPTSTAAQPPAETTPETAVYCLYTSGTSGTPKGVIVEDRGLTNLHAEFIDPLLTAEGVGTVGLIAPFAFDASIKMIYGALTTGRHLRVLTAGERDDVTGLAARLAAWNVDALDCTPTYLGVLCDTWQRGPAAHLTALLVGGEALDTALADRAAALTGATVYNVYGPTEATVDATCHRHEPGTRMTIGRAIPGADVRVVRNGRALGRGLPGEIWIGGAGVARGYLDAPELTAEKFTEDPFGPGSGRFYRTGDRGRTLPDGNLEYLGRLDEQVKVRGFRIEPAEIARAMESLPGIGSAAAVVTGEGLLIGYYTADTDTDVISGLRLALPEHMVPAHTVRLDRMPLTANGKLDLAELRRRQAPRPRKGAHVEPATVEETAVAAAIRAVLKLDTISMDANFFMLGGDSIKAILLVSALADAGHRLSVRDVMSSLTPAEMARRIEPRPAAVAAVSPEGVVAPTPITADFFGRGYPAPHHHHQTAELPLDPAAIPHLRSALRELTHRHRILSAVVSGDRLVVPPLTAAAPPVLEDWDLTEHSPDDAAAERARRATALCAATDLATGPLMRAAVVRTPDGTALFLAIHHLVVDGVSWHVIARDIANLTAALAAGRDLPAPPDATSFRAFAETLGRGAPRPNRDIPALPPAQGPADGRRRRERIVLDSTTTAALVADRATARDPDAQDLLVAAVTTAAHRIWGLDRVPLTLESHGRTGAADAAAVGWFTETYPVVVPVCHDPREQLREARAALGGEPGGDGGETLGTVNYLGEVTGPGLNPYGEASSPLNVDRARLSVDASVVAGELLIDVAVRHDAASADDTAAFTETLRAALTGYAARTARTGLAPVPADYGLDTVTLAQLDALLGDNRPDAVHPLSPLQEGMLYEHMRGTGDHVVQVEYAFPATTDPDRLARAFAELSARTPALRTVFAWDAHTAPHQLVLPGTGVEFAHVDHRALSEQDRRAALEEHCARQHDRPFDLRRGPLFRCDAFTHADDSHVLVFTHHHAVLDGWSLSELCRRFTAIHDALTSGAAMPDGETDGGPIPPHGAYTRLLAERGSEAFDAYWSRLLDGHEGGVEITGVEADGTGTGRLAASSTTGLASRLQSAFSARGATLAHVAEAAWGLVLSRQTGTPDVVFGKVVSGRDVALPGVDKTVGLFINTVPVRVRLDPATTAAGLVDAVRVQAVATGEHDHGSLARIQSVAGVEDLVRCVFAVENYHVAEDATALVFRRAREATNYPLTVTVERVGDELEVTVLHDRAVLGTGDAGRLSGRLLAVLEEFAADAVRPLTKVAGLVAGERERVLDVFDASCVGYVRDGWIGGVFAGVVAGHGERVALVAGDERLTYRELAARAGAVAEALAGAGVATGDLVGLVGAAGVELFVGLLGVTLSGAGYVPIDVEAPASRSAAIIADAGITVIVAAGQRGAEVAASAARDARCVDVAVAVGGGYRRAEVAGAPGGGDAAYVMFTSGTTGRPKGSVIPQRAVLRLVCGNPSLPLGPEDVLVQTGSVAFDASTFEIWGMWLNGGTLVIPDREDLLAPERLGGLITRTGATVMWLTVSLFNHIAVTAPEQLSGLTRLFIGGEAVGADQVRRLYDADADVQVINGYGPTENTTFTTTHPIPRGFDRVPIGRAIGGTSVVVLDGDRVCGIGEVGELCAGGDGLSTGYLGLPELTAQRFVSSPYGRLYRTGDRVRRLADGTIEYLGRQDDQQVKIRGYRIELPDIETTLRRHPHIRDAVVIAERRAEATALIAYVVAEAGEVDTAELRFFLDELLPSYMVPAHLVPIAEIPLTRNGKLDRRALPDPEPPAATEGEAPADEVEAVVCAAFAEVLGLPVVGVLDSFFELGGDSIKAIRVVSRVRQAGFEVAVGAVMAAGTARGVAARVERATASSFEQGAVTGAVGSWPIAEEFFAWELTVPSHFNQDILIDIADATVEEVRSALDAVWAHHDALRAIVKGRAVHLRGVEAAYGFEHHQAGDVGTVLADVADRLHASMDFAGGPLFQAALVGSRLFLAAHHLVVDAVSWQIITDDVLTGIRDTRTGRPIKLAEKTASLHDWTNALADLTATLVPAEQAYWNAVETAMTASRGPDVGVGMREFALDPGTTAELLGGLAAAYHADVEDLLLAALVMSIPQPSVAVRVEKHGRTGHDALPPVDRTVGWFTTMFPIVLHHHTDPAEALITTKETLRTVPHDGIGYGLRPGGYTNISAAVSFNYLGRQDSTGVAFAGTGTPTHPGNRALPGITVNVVVRDERLTVSVANDGGEFAARYEAALAVLIAHCRTPRARETTPSDHTAATALSRVDLAALRAAHPGLEDVADLTPMQEGMLFHGLEGEASGAYVVQQVFRVTDEVAFDLGSVRAALRGLGERHPMLRTAFVAEGLDRPRQVVLRDREIGFSTVDLRQHATTTVDDVLAAEVTRGFDLTHDPLLRVTAIHSADNGRDVLRLAWTYHHIILDGWSLSTLFGDFLRLLRGGVLSGDAGPGYAAHVRHLASRDEDAFEAYWSRLLSGYATNTAIATTAHADPGGTGRVEASSTRGLARRLTERYAALGATLSHVTEAAWALVLGRAAGSDDVVFGKVVSGRDAPIPGIDKTVGLFINTIPVRVRTEGGTTVADLVEAVRDQALASAGHDHGSLARVQSLAGGGALVSTLFAFENFHVETGTIHGAGLEFEKGREQTNYPVNLVVQQDGDELAFSVLYDPALLARSTVERLLARVVQVLDRFAEDAHVRVTDVPTLLPGEATSVRDDVNATVIPYAEEATAVSLFLDGVRAHPERTALVWGERSMTYAELAEAASAVAGELITGGVPRGAAVGVLGERSTHVIVGILGAMLAGCHFIPLDVTAPAGRAARIVADSGMRAVLTYGSRAAAMAAGLPGDVAVVDLAVAREAAEVLALRPPSSDDLAYCIYTSGTTGVPKGVMLRHRGVVNLRAYLREVYAVTADDRVLQFSNLTFDASVWEIALSLLNGAGLVIVDQDTVHDTALLAGECHRSGVTLGLLPPQYYLLCEGLPLRIVTTGGGASSLAVVEKARRENVPYVNAYGPTETTVLATGWHDTGEALVDPARIPIGVPVANTQVHILHGERLCGIGEAGELSVAGDGLSTGYIGLSELTTEKFTPNPHGPGRLYRTGDRARRLNNGTIEYLGRIDDQQVKIRGHRIELAEVETAIREHPAVRDAVVIDHREPDGSTALAAYVVPTAGAGHDGLRTFLAERLPGYMIPAYLAVIAAVPLNRSGKLDRAALPAPALDAREGVSAASEAERVVCAAFADVLGIDAIGATDSFFELGGDSIKAIRVVSRIRAAGHEVSVGAVMAGMTARAVAARLDRATAPGEQGEVTGLVEGRTPITDAFFDWDLAVPGHFDQDVLIDVGDATAAQVRAALDGVWAHHDTLRSVVRDRRLLIRPSGEARYAFTHEQAGTPELLPAAIEAAAGRARAAIDLTDGPLLSAALVTAPGTARLFLTAHHLVVDAVSRQILVEDVHAGIGATGLPAKTASTKDWATALDTLAETLVPAERAHWDAVEDSARAVALPTHPGPAVSDIRLSTLDHDRTAAVLAAGAAYHASTEDVLLAALAMSLGEVTGRERIAVRLEGHGRSGHDALPAADRSVGWFTAMYPVVLDRGDDPGKSLVAAKEALRAVPHRGIGYGLRPGGYAKLPASVTFNYLGDQTGDHAFAHESTPSHPDNRLLEGVRVNVFLEDGRLTASIAFETHTLTPEQADSFAELYPRALGDLADHCASVGTRQRTLSDTDATDLSGSDLDVLNALFGG